MNLGLLKLVLPNQRVAPQTQSPQIHRRIGYVVVSRFDYFAKMAGRETDSFFLFGCFLDVNCKRIFCPRQQNQNQTKYDIEAIE